MKSIFAVILVLAAATCATFVQTDGFTVLTTEAARRARIAHEPMPIPAAHVQQANGQVTDLGSLLATDKRVTIVNFMYTRCASVCVAMGLEFQQLQAEIVRRGLADRVRLLSISFDARDTPEWLGRYQARMRADPEIWQSVLAPYDVERQALLNAFGIVVIPAPLAQFEHNTAYHVVTSDGRLTRIVDINHAQYALYYALQQADEKVLS